MEQIQELRFFTPFGVELGVGQIIREIVRFIEEDQRHSYKVIIGTDSQALDEHRADFVTALVVHRVGNGGRYFWRRMDFGKFYTLRDRIIQEVVASLDTAKVILTELRATNTTNWDFEIHADVGSNGNTKVLIQEVVGMIRANDFEAKTKPDSYAASKVADRYV